MLQRRKEDRHAIFLPSPTLLNAIYKDIQANCHGYWEFPVAIWHEVKDKLAPALLLAAEQKR